jgi:hypothetical protein
LYTTELYDLLEMDAEGEATISQIMQKATRGLVRHGGIAAFKYGLNHANKTSSATKRIQILSTNAILLR